MEVRPQVTIYLDLESRYLAVPRKRGFGVYQLRPRLGRRQETLPSRLHPLHGKAALQRQERHGYLLRIDFSLDSEPPADVRGNYSDAILGQP